ncbi:ANTAR domain-containing protein [Marmoricola sp. Leaf446]|uniref:ANTAR domain-containing protein n=1 Tax=Marmoricola sp. Leaf446 TaxID=1736379 RepID=UPI0012E3DBA4|nr:ANTAR domain-containing protein [Marmoricola sp. Leaf446]
MNDRPLVSTPTDVPPAHRAVDDVEALEREVTRLREALADRSSVEQAKGMLMLAYGYGPQRADHLLRRWASDLGVSERTVAESMVEAIDTSVEDEVPNGPRLTAVPTQRFPGD